MRTKSTILLLFSLLMGAVSSSYAAPTYKLYITTAPKDAEIRIMNIKPKYHQGIELETGSYDLMISKEGYQPLRKWIGIRNKHRRLHFELEPEEIQAEAKYGLTIDTVPKNARIYVMNMRERFEQGVELPPGKYDLMVTARGFSPKRQWVDIVDQDANVKVVLGKPEETVFQVESTDNKIAQNTETTTTQKQPIPTNHSNIKKINIGATSVLKKPGLPNDDATVVGTTVSDISEFVDDTLDKDVVDETDLGDEESDAETDVAETDVYDAEDAMADDEEDIASDEDIDDATDDVAEAEDDAIEEIDDVDENDESAEIDDEEDVSNDADDTAGIVVAKAEITQTPTPVKALTLNAQNNTQEISQYALTIDTIPSDARIYIMTIKPKFEQGISLMPGKYDLWVKKGNLSVRRWIEMTDHDMHLTVNLNEDTLVEATPKKRYKLTVNTVPEGARVLIMNIIPKFHQGILLKPGKYDLLVKKAGYPKMRQWIPIENSDVEVNVVLGDPQEEADDDNVTTLASVDTSDDVSMDTDDETTDIEEVTDAEDVKDNTEAVVEEETDVIEEEVEDNNAPIQKDKPVQKYALNIKTTPANAKVEILNMPEPFKQGMLLPPGKYLVHTSKSGYPLRRDWAIIEEGDVTLQIILSKQSLCFFSEEISEKVEQSYSVVRSAKVKFRGQFVDVSYYEHSIPAGLSDHLEFQGIQKGEMLEMVALVEKGGKMEEVQASMKLQDNQLWVDVNGSQGVLEPSTCF